MNKAMITTGFILQNTYNNFKNIKSCLLKNIDVMMKISILDKLLNWGYVTNEKHLAMVIVYAKIAGLSIMSFTSTIYFFKE